MLAPAEIEGDMEWIPSLIEVQVERIGAKIESEVKGSVDYVGNKTMNLEEGAMYAGLDMH